MRVLLLVLFCAAAAQAQHDHSATSPYAGQKNSPVRGLTAQELDDRRQGRGMGLARAAELNSYPGPRHVLELKEKLGLSPDQAQRTEAIFRAMETEAKQLGAQAIEVEKQISDAFASARITPGELDRLAARLGPLQARLRAAHLRAHIATRALLTPAQIAHYNELRGYSGYSTAVDHSHSAAVN